MASIFGLDIGRQGKDTPTYTRDVNTTIRNSLINWIYSNPLENYSGEGLFGKVISLLNKSPQDGDLKKLEEDAENLLLSLSGVEKVKVNVEKNIEVIDISIVFVYNDGSIVEEHHGDISIAI